MSTRENKNRLQTLLDGGIPDVPPTWELVFQIEKEFFGMPPRSTVRNAPYGSERVKMLALWQYDFDIYERCVEALGWAAIPGSYNPEELAFRKKQIGQPRIGGWIRRRRGVLDARGRQDDGFFGATV